MSQGTHWKMKLEKDPDERHFNSMRPDISVWFDPEDSDECITVSVNASIGHTQRYVTMTIKETKQLIGYLEASIQEAIDDAEKRLRGNQPESVAHPQTHATAESST